MKTIFGIFIIIASFISNAQAQENFIQKHLKSQTESKDFTSISMSLSSGLAEEILKDIQADLGAEKGWLDLIKNLTQLQVLTTEKQSQKYYQTTLALIQKENYKSLMSVKEGGETGVNIVAKEGRNGIEEILVLVGEKDEFVLVCFSGTKI